MLIAISGFDYSGKSTQIRALKTSNPASVLWSRIGYTPLLIRIKRVARKCMRQSTDVVSREWRRIADVIDGGFQTYGFGHP